MLIHSRVIHYMHFCYRKTWFPKQKAGTVTDFFVCVCVCVCVCVLVFDPVTYHYINIVTTNKGDQYKLEIIAEKPQYFWTFHIICNQN